MYNHTLPRWLNYLSALVTSNDLDPVYVGVNSAISNGDLSAEQSRIFLTMMSLFYSIEESCKVVHLGIQSNDLWDYAIDNYATLKRGTERRYFRGDQGMKCLDYLKANYKGANEFVLENYAPDYETLSSNLNKIPAFGPYHIWKWLDFYERVLNMPVKHEWKHILKVMPSEPIKGARMVSEELWPTEPFSLERVVRHMIEESIVYGVKAPPNKDRHINIQEVETALCGIYHIYKGVDWVGKDVNEKYDAVAEVGDAGLFLLKNMPPKVSRDYLVDPTFRRQDSTNSLEFL